MKPVLSICIPTYNREVTLRYCLDSILKSRSNYLEEVEIVVSNNASDDNTLEMLKEVKNNVQNFYYYSNDNNIGFNNNLFKLTDIYAKGKFCWVIGDDDFLDVNAIPFILNLINNNKSIDFISVNFRLLTLFEYKEYRYSNELNEQISYDRMSYECLLNKACRSENLMNSFMSSSIFRLEPFKSESKEMFSADSWSHFYNTFPHAYLFSKIFLKSSSVYVKTPLLTASVHEKSWDDKLPRLFLKIIPKLYNYHIDLGYSRLKLLNLKNTIAKSGSVLLLKPLKVNSKISFIICNMIYPGFYKGFILSFYKLLFGK